MKDWIKTQGDAVSLSLVIQPRATKNEIDTGVSPTHSHKSAIHGRGAALSRLRFGAAQRSPLL